MSLDPMPYIIAATLIGAALGYCAGGFMASAKHRGIYNRAWNAGRDFAQRKDNEIQ